MAIQRGRVAFEEDEGLQLRSLGPLNDLRFLTHANHKNISRNLSNQQFDGRSSVEPQVTQRQLSRDVRGVCLVCLGSSGKLLSFSSDGGQRAAGSTP